MAVSKREPITPSEEEGGHLDRVMHHPTTPRNHVCRAYIVLSLGSGCTLSETMRRTGKSKPTVYRWWERFLAEERKGLPVS